MSAKAVRLPLVFAVFFGAANLTACHPKVGHTKLVRAANFSGGAKVEQAEWITYKADQVLWRVRARDDGHVIESVLHEEEGEVLTLRHERLRRRVLVSQGDAKAVERKVPEGLFALANGDWPAFTLVGEAFPTPFSGKIRILLPENGALRDGDLTIEPTTGGKRLQMLVGPVGVIVDLDLNNHFVRAVVPSQNLAVLPALVRLPAAAGEKPSGVEELEFIVSAPNAELHGTLWSPATAESPPLAVIVAGSGPTDRNGDNPLGAFGRSYAILASELAKHQIATLRYDKRGVGASTLTMPASEVTLAHIIDDAARIVAYARSLGRFSRIVIVGHSEGGLIAMDLASQRHADAIVLLATPGRGLNIILREQIARQVDAGDLPAVEETLAAWKAGRDVPVVPRSLQRIERGGLKGLKSMLSLDPRALAQRVNVPATVVQGTDDVQVATEDAEELALHNSSFRVRFVPGMAHSLKRPIRDPFQLSRSEPLAEGLVDIVVAAIREAL